MANQSLILCHSLFLSEEDRYKIVETNEIITVIGIYTFSEKGNKPFATEEVFCQYNIVKNENSQGFVKTKSYGFDIALDNNDKIKKLLNVEDRGAEFLMFYFEENLDKTILKHQIIINDILILEKSLTTEFEFQELESEPGEPLE